MKLLKLKSKERLESEITRIAREAVDRCEFNAIAAVGATVHAESIHFARGFIRAKAGGLLRTEIAAINLAPALQKQEITDAAFELALENLSQLVLGELLKANRLQRMVRLAA